MNDKESMILEKIRAAGAGLPKFEDGRIDYTNATYAPVLNIFVEWDGKLLLLKRSDKVLHYKGKWNSIGGYLDEVRPVKEKVMEELREELSLDEGIIEKMDIGKPYEEDDRKIKMTWYVVPVLIKLKREPKIKLDWEHTEYKWIKPGEIGDYDTIADLKKTFENAKKR